MFNTNKFSYSVNDKTFITEASDINYTGREFLELISERTGATSEWCVQKLERDREQEIVAWHLIPTKATLTKYPKLAEHKMIIYND